MRTLPPTLSDVIDHAYVEGRLDRARIHAAMMWALESGTNARDPYVRALWDNTHTRLSGILEFIDHGHEGHDRVWLRLEVLRLTDALRAEQNINEHPERWGVNRKLERQIIDLANRYGTLEKERDAAVAALADALGKQNELEEQLQSYRDDDAVRGAFHRRARE